MMPHSPIMAGNPASERLQVTLANWMVKPFNEWAFQNVRQVLPTANIRRSHASAAIPLNLQNLEGVSFEGADGRQQRLAAGGGFEIDGLIVLHRGSIVWEYYDHGFTPQSQHIVFSVTKSFTGTLSGILADLGKLDPKDPVTKYLPEAKGTAYESATVQHLLDMSVGIKFHEEYLESDGDVTRYRRAAGWTPNNQAGLPTPHLREFLMTLQPSGAPHGETFHYVSPNSDVLGWVLERAGGMAFHQLMERYIWGPIGAEEDAYIGVDSRSMSRAAGGFCATLRDLARFGEMMRNNGISSTGQRVVPKWWIDDIQRNGDPKAWAHGEYTKLFPKGNYRNKWYMPDLDRRAFCAIGIHGQYIYVDPEDEIVIVRVSSQPVPFDVPNDRSWVRACRAIGNHLNGRG